VKADRQGLLERTEEPKDSSNLSQKIIYYLTSNTRVKQ
jgi:hypothetical protein